MSRRAVRSGLVAAVMATASFAVVGSGTAGAVTCGPVDPEIADGDPGSLRNLLQDDDGDGCDSVTLVAGAIYVLDLDLGLDSDIDIWGPMVIEGNGATIRQTQDDRVLATNSDLTLRNLTITGGRALDGTDGGGLEAGSGTVVIENVVFIDNSATDEGGALDLDGPVTIRNSTLVGNAAGNDGGAIDADSESSVTVIGSTIADNCAEDDGGAAEIENSFTLVNSTVTGNRSADAALDVNLDTELVLVYSDVVRNILDDEVDCGVLEPQAVTEPAPLAEGELPAQVEPDDTESEEPESEDVAPQAAGEASNISINGLVRSFGTVVAEPLLGATEPGPAINCEGPTEVTSSGYNFSDDATCGFLAATDRQSAGSPLLGALADNGGPTQTLLPLALSPLENAIPLASCGDGNGLAGFPVTTDQRGVGRPQGAGCEIGSVEIELVLSFTG